jgi:putative transposase
MLNEATQAWAEFDHNRKIHSEIGEAPITRFLAGPDVTRPCPDSDALPLAFTRTDHRMQRKSDGTVVIEGQPIYHSQIPSHCRSSGEPPAKSSGA